MKSESGIQRLFSEKLCPDEIKHDGNSAIEEILNSLLHAIGAGMSIAGLVVLLLLSANNPSPWKYTAFSVYGSSQIILYLSSALLHASAPFPLLQRHFSRLDHASIYLLIAGTYTPITLVILRTPLGWTLFGIVWGLSIFGFIMKMWVVKKPNIVIDSLYIPLGWMILMAIGPLARTAPPGFLLWAIIGGVTYSLGFIFYAWKKLPYSHVIWHLFVLAGSIAFYLGFAIYIAPVAMH
ncbi:PAQR family membrane homeostasis protein TrhA [Salinispira pacifica]|uniref:Putative membrane protein n=1 Tax=Salinispira pacifica TaxID=1307761 RepID=V5WI96_9SPIO|nr:hemolysin III family protein [Salinispira pacifica]AHC15355.1 putative membrane protein [Salinispira pacifica]